MWPLLIIALLTALLGSSLFFCRRKLSQRWSRKGSLKAEESRLRRFQLEEVAKATKNFSAECLLGSEAFGNVYKGTFELHGTLAIKIAHADSYQSVDEFRNGNKLWPIGSSYLDLLNVNFCNEPKGAKILVYEYVPYGSLLEYIMGRGGRNLTWRQRVNIAIGAAKGIAYLHDGIKPSIIHRDIKPSNILIGDGMEAKVSDFGLVKLGPVGDESHVSSQIKGTPGYLDPTSCTTFHLTPFSDVYSFGVILLQLVSARPVVDSSTRCQPNYHIIDWARPSIEKSSIEEILDISLLSQAQACNMEMMLKMGELGLRCVEKMPKNRPTMARVWQELEDTLHLVDNSTHKQPWRSSGRATSKFAPPTERVHHRSLDKDFSQSFVSIDGVGFQKFRIEMDSVSLQSSSSLRCFELNTNDGVEVDKKNLTPVTEETSNQCF
ncbi:hypothetical protein ES288_A11G195200v1 [Gossypium darwinii]|uniref:Protein kinase domain-containing protein n=1 Tax=Gossypium darwinii TaxID=34276 RepID=A0A5D2EN31_GOSDA|nr:hypothetical protein ES288_A11G195200v1 [Gossypium darwinii]